MIHITVRLYFVHQFSCPPSQILKNFCSGLIIICMVTQTKIHRYFEMLVENAVKPYTCFVEKCLSFMQNKRPCKRTWKYTLCKAICISNHACKLYQDSYFIFPQTFLSINLHRSIVWSSKSFSIFFKDLLIYSNERMTEGDTQTERERSSICWLTVQMDTRLVLGETKADAGNFIPVSHVGAEVQHLGHVQLLSQERSISR